MARASAQRCCCPPDNCPGLRSSRWSILTLRAASRTAGSISAFGRFAISSGKAMFCEHRHVRIERVALEHHGDVAILGVERGDVLAVDRRRAPEVGMSRPARMRKVVLFPEPDGPSSAKNSPGSISKSIAFEGGEIAMHLDDPVEMNLSAHAHRRPPPFTAPTVRPLTICFCATMPRTITGSIARTETAASFVHRRLLDGDEVEHRDGDRPDGVAAQDDGEQELVPGIEEHEHDGDRDAAPHLRDDDAPQRFQRLAPSI